MQTLIWGDIQRFVAQNGIQAAFFAAAVLFICGCVHAVVKRKRIGAARSTGIYLFAGYCFMVMAIALLTREPGSRTKVDLIPFSTFFNSPRAMAYVVENVLMMIPLGIFLPGLFGRFRNGGRCLAAGFLCSAVIECTQFVTGRGFFQTDDIITNVIGTGIGYLLFFVGYQMKK